MVTQASKIALYVICKEVPEKIQLRKKTFGAEKEAFQEFCQQNTRRVLLTKLEKSREHQHKSKSTQKTIKKV